MCTGGMNDIVTAFGVSNITNLNGHAINNTNNNNDNENNNLTMSMAMNALNYTMPMPALQLAAGMTYIVAKI